MQKPKDKVKAKTAQQKVEKLLEFDERKKTIHRFMKVWNSWRKFYFQAPPLEVKTPGQITMIENSIDFCKERGLDLNLVIACIHKSYERSKTFRPGFNEIVSKGEEKLHMLEGEVVADIENAEIERLSLGD